MNDTKTDEKYMAMALDLAEKGRGRTSPNPMVGAVVVKDGKVVGRGWHRKAGTPHAEALALDEAGEKAEGATLYVNLEPCCHTDKLTPPCSEAVIKSKVARLVVCTPDPNPKVSGKGLQALKDAGIEVTEGVLSERAARLNEVFFKYIRTGMPFVTMKVAQTLDGKIATSTGESKWITGPQARRLGHAMRNQADAIVVGIGTVLRDDPSLTTRLDGVENTRDPHRVILDSHLRIPLDARVLNAASDAYTYVATTLSASTHKMKDIKARNGHLLIVDEEDGRVSLPLLLEEVAKLGMTNVLMEGGARVNAEALKAGVVDKVAFFIAPKLLGGDDAKGSIGGKSPDTLDGAALIHDMRFSRVGDDILIEGYINKAGAAQGEPEDEGMEPSSDEAAKKKPAHKRRRRHRH